MKIWVGITDKRWFDFLSSLKPTPDEVNFWQPSDSTTFKAITPKELFLFKLHSPLNYIVGGGFFETSTIIPISLAWETFKEKNGVNLFEYFLPVIKTYRNVDIRNLHNTSIVCNILSSPFFFAKEDWVPIPKDFSLNIVRGKTYNTDQEEGANLFKAISDKLHDNISEIQTDEVNEGNELYGNPFLTRARLGQGGFRLIVTDVYRRKCAITGERTLPALEAAHIKPMSNAGPNDIRNGLLLRADLHKLFDNGYITITKDFRIEVSRKIKEEFENGRDYYMFHGNLLKFIPEEQNKPAENYIEWHNNNIYLA